MSELPKGSSGSDTADAPDAPRAVESAPPVASGASSSNAFGAAFVTASHTALFDDAAAPRCDVCDAVLPEDDDAADTRTGEVRDDAHMPSGRGLLVWTRGDERRYQEPPLCPGCAAAIGMTALQRWEIEEEEG